MVVLVAKGRRLTVFLGMLGSAGEVVLNFSGDVPQPRVNISSEALVHVGRDLLAVAIVEAGDGEVVERAVRDCHDLREANVSIQSAEFYQFGFAPLVCGSESDARESRQESALARSVAADYHNDSVGKIDAEDRARIGCREVESDWIGPTGGVKGEADVDIGKGGEVSGKDG